jgi:quinol monooxygenase YgiN
MSDLDVIAVLTAKVGSEEIVGAGLRSIVEPTRAEPGCVSYDLYTSAASPQTFITIERWKSQADLDAHMTTPHIAELVAAAGEHLADIGVHPLIPDAL